MHVEVVLSPAEIGRLPSRSLEDVTCVVFDVLRATSTILTALAHGARRIYPVGTIDEARELRRAQCPEALLGGEREGVRIEGFDLGNSPLEYSTDVVSGRDIIMTTTNGTIALQACAGAAKVYAGALLNLAALSAAIRRQEPPPRTLLLVCAGSGEHFALEDGLAAAALRAELPESSSPNDAEIILDALHRNRGERPLEALRSSSNGRRLTSIGLAEDVAYCAQTSVLDAVGVLVRGALQIEPGPSDAP